MLKDTEKQYNNSKTINGIKPQRASSLTVPSRIAFGKPSAADGSRYGEARSFSASISGARRRINNAHYLVKQNKKKRCVVFIFN